MAHNASFSYPLSGRQALPSLNRWAALFLIGLAVLSLLFSWVLHGLGPVALLGILTLVVSIPLLLRLETVYLWFWLLLFPVLYYEPLSLGSVVLGPRVGLVLALTLVVALPGALLSLLTRWPEHRRLIAVSTPLWFLLVALGLDLFRFFSLFHPSYLIRDGMTVLVSLYLLIIGWQWIQKGEWYQEALMKGFLGIGLFNAVVVVLERYTHFGLVEAGGFLRPMGIFGFPILASLMSVLTLIVAMYGYFQATEQRSRWLYRIAILFLLMGCVMSLTKTNILQLGLIMTLWLVLSPKVYKAEAVKLALVLAGAALFWIVVVDQGELVQQLSNRFQRMGTFEVRQAAWHILMSDMTLETLIRGNGWMSGTALLGVHNYEYALFPIDLATKGGPQAIHPHNAYIKYVYELGLLGLGMLLSYVAIMLRGFYGALTARLPKQRLANLAIGTLVLALLFASLTGSPMAENYTLGFFSLLTLYFGYQAGWFAPSKA